AQMLSEQIVEGKFGLAVRRKICNSFSVKSRLVGHYRLPLTTDSSYAGCSQRLPTGLWLASPLAHPPPFRPTQLTPSLHAPPPRRLRRRVWHARCRQVTGKTWH